MTFGVVEAIVGLVTGIVTGFVGHRYLNSDCRVGVGESAPTISHYNPGAQQHFNIDHQVIGGVVHVPVHLPRIGMVYVPDTGLNITGVPHSPPPTSGSLSRLKRYMSRQNTRVEPEQEMSFSTLQVPGPNTNPGSNHATSPITNT